MTYNQWQIVKDIHRALVELVKTARCSPEARDLVLEHLQAMLDREDEEIHPEIEGEY